MKIFSLGVTRIGVAPIFVSTAALRLRKALSSTGFSDKALAPALGAPSSSKKASNFAFGATTLTASSDSFKTSASCAGVLTESERAADPVPNRLGKKLDSCAGFSAGGANDATGATSEILSSTEGTDFGITTAAAFFFCSAFFFASSKVTSASSFCKSMSGTVLVS